MKILHVADLHLDHDWFDWVASHSVDYELLVIAGDLQNAFSNSGMQDQARAVTRWLLSLSTPTVVCSGNHDYWARDTRFKDEYAEADWIKLLKGQGSIIGVDGDLVNFKGLKILVNGWLQTPPDTQRVDIVVTHAPPAWCECAGDAPGSDFGDPVIWDSLEDHPPALLLCGHIHTPRKFHCAWPPLDRTTMILIPGCDEQSEIPAHWVVDTSTKIATHSGGDACGVLRPSLLRP
jgi:Icc-related predicted phosphoesterase